MNQSSEIIKQPIYRLLILILAGESVFILPFVLARIFRPTFLDVFQINNLQLGACFSVYGIVAMISYFLGGSLADKYKTNVLISISLIMTAIGGLIMAMYPSYLILNILFGFWGFSTIFLFWAPMIKATRIWGGNSNQTKAFGFLDGGRGLVAAGVGSIGVLIYGFFFEDDATNIALEDKQEAFKSVLLFATFFVFTIGLLSYFLLKNKAEENLNFQAESISLKNIGRVIKLPIIWHLMIIVLCAYFAYKVTDIITLYANEVMLYDQIKSAKVGTFILYLRPVIGILIGISLNRIKSTSLLIYGFAIMVVSALIFSLGIISPTSTSLFYITIVTIAVGTYSVRALYFAAINEGQIPLHLTGTAVGVISFVGFTPDIFSGPLMGYFLDHFEGEKGHQYVFFFMVMLSIIGLVFSILFKNKLEKKKTLNPHLPKE